MSTELTFGDFVRKYSDLGTWIAYCRNMRGMTGFEKDRGMYDRQIENGSIEMASLEVNYPGFARDMRRAAL